MIPALLDARVRRVLDALHAESETVDPPLLAEANGKDGAERTALLDRAYLDYVRNPANGYVSVSIPIGDAMELSVLA